MGDKSKEDIPEEVVNTSAGNFSLGINILSSILVGMAMGYGLDKFFDTAPWLMVLFIFLGFAAGIRSVWKQMQHQLDDE